LRKRSDDSISPDQTKDLRKGGVTVQGRVKIVNWAFPVIWGTPRKFKRKRLRSVDKKNWVSRGLRGEEEKRGGPSQSENGRGNTQ